MKKSVFQNYLFNLCYQIFLVVIPVITTPYLSRVLDAGSIGNYDYVCSKVSMVVLIASLGFAVHGQREIAFHQNDRKECYRILWAVQIVKTITFGIMTLLYLFLYCRSGSLALFYRIELLQILGSYLDVSWVFSGQEDFKKIVNRNFIIKILNVAAIFLFVKSVSDLDIYFYITSISLLASNGILWFYLPQYVERTGLQKLGLWSHFISMLILFLPQVAIQIYTVLDKVMLGDLSTSEQVGYYTQAEKIVKLSITVVTSLSTVLMPRIAASVSGGTKEQLQRYFTKAIQIVGLLAIPLMFGIIGVADQFIPWFLGDGYEPSRFLLKLLSVLTIIIGTASVTGTAFMIPLKLQKEYTVSVVVGALVNLCVNYLLIPRIHSTGAAIATILAELSVLVIQLYCLHKYFHFMEAVRTCYKFLTAGMIMFVYLLFTEWMHLFQGTFVLLNIAIAGAIYGIMLLVLKEPLLLEVMQQLKQRFMRGEKS
ncbi:MAG: flippase [Clostridiales bacterium]|nr:flippase [Clostridiales bacterium]